MTFSLYEEHTKLQSSTGNFSRHNNKLLLSEQRQSTSSAELEMVSFTGTRGGEDVPISDFVRLAGKLLSLSLK